MALWDAFFLVVPVVSSTFASFPRLFAGVGREQLVWLRIDEAGQSTPQAALGAIWRSRRVVVVGDPLQLEPITGAPRELRDPLLRRTGAERQWCPPAASAQVLADRANRWGMLLPAGGGTAADGEGIDGDATWLGCPLRVHRRCLDPMYSIANEVAYGGTMFYGAGADSGSLPGIGPSHWIHVSGEGAKGHWVPAQGQLALELVDELTAGQLRDGSTAKVYVITPLRAVADKLKDAVERRYRSPKVRDMCGTVHTFQGKEADYVIFVLGGDPKRPGVINAFAGAKPNLVNVAVSRAKKRLYVIGDHDFWTRNDGRG